MRLPNKWPGDCAQPRKTQRLSIAETGPRSKFGPVAGFPWGPGNIYTGVALQGLESHNQHSKIIHSLGAAHSMWPFDGKKVLKRENLPIGEDWRLAEGTHDGNPMFVRTNAAYRPFKGVQGYAHQVGIAVPLVDPEPSGLPSTIENAELSTIEDNLCGLLQTANESIFVAAITTSGMREFVFYTRDPERVKQRFEEARRRIQNHEIHLMIQPDSEWNIYARLI
jgi:hypothetical protein